EALRRLRRRTTLGNERILITAGPTLEDIDPARFISNRSSGKMGYALAEEAAARGARVTLVSGPTHQQPPAAVEFVPVRSAEQMLTAVLTLLPVSTVLIKAAAVADFRPAQVQPQKIKKSTALSELKLEPTTDILRAVQKIKNGQIVIGFAAETE